MERYRCDALRLSEALVEHLEAYRAQLAAELPSLADRDLVAHLRRLDALAARAQAGGLTLLARQDAVAADSLLTDLCAVATWHGWPLPLERLEDLADLPAGAQRGLLGADVAGTGAGLWVLDHATIALARNRQVGDAALWHGRTIS